MPKGLISGTFNEGMRMKRFGNVSSLARNTRNKSKSFSFLDMETRPLFMFSTFQIFDYRISKNIQANPCVFKCDNKKGPPNKRAKFH